MKKNRKLWIVSAALVAVVLVAVLCLLLPRLQVEPGVPKSGAIVRHAILGEDSKVCKNAIVGGAYADGEKKKISVTSKGAVVEANTVLKPGDML